MVIEGRSRPGPRLRETLARITEEAAHLLDVEGAGLRLREGDELVRVAAYGPEGAVMARERLKLGESLSGAVFAAGQALIVDTPETEPSQDPVYRMMAERYGFRSWLGVPLRDQERVIGVLVMQSRTERRFGPADVRLLEAFAGQAAVAIENAQLFEREHARRRQLEAVREVTAGLASETDLAALLDLISRLATELLGVRSVAVYLWDEASATLVPRAGSAPHVAYDPAQAAHNPSITWIGHATVLVQMDGLNIVTDPAWSERASPFQWIGPKRAQPPGVALADLPHVDLVLVSHNHYDHFDEASVRALAAQPGGPPLFVVGLGLKEWLAGIGITNAVELDWWQSTRLGAVEVVMTPVQHWSARGLHDRMKTLWGGFAVFGPSMHLFHAGDTGYSKDFADIRARFADRQRGGGFDLALLPVGGYEPRWFMAQQHVNPEEAVRIHRDLGAKRSLGMHWGTFQLTDESLDAPPADCIQDVLSPRMSRPMMGRFQDCLQSGWYSAQASFSK